MTRKLLLFACFSACNLLYGQYTEVINSNRPGYSMSAFSVGTGVIQGEAGLGYHRFKHTKFNDSKVGAFGPDITLRYGFFKEQLEVHWQFAYLFDKLTNNSLPEPVFTKRSGFLTHTLGIKYLVYDPYRKRAEEKPNLYSWKANYAFRWRDLIPAVAIYAGVNIVLDEQRPYIYNNVFNLSDAYINDPFYESGFTPKVVLAAQNHIGTYWVVVSNLVYDKFTSDFPEFSYVVTLTHTQRNPKWSIFGEIQGVKSDRYGDVMFRAGCAYLFSENIQLDASAGKNFKETPSRLFFNLGASYRIDNHKDKTKKDVMEREKEGEFMDKMKKSKKARKQKKRESKQNKKRIKKSKEDNN